ncbi:GGDEF domain-containing protein [Sulfurimonas sp. SAG-AH-194-C21]|nr:GGDEF domain-containing protein [Sulfurimonas sp. SAG-AH-194-C21]MDF1884010.1 GGDEF domain-containing protein [Sulfurimonas sp. SAG-AH-194-C21]
MLMKQSALYKNLLLSNLELEMYNPTTRKIVLLNILLYISSLLLGFFTLYNVFIDEAYYIALIDFMAFVGAVYALIDMRIRGDIKRASLIATLDIFLLMIALVYVIKGQDFTLIWTVFLPIFAIFINGSKIGSVVTIVFYSIIFTIAYNGLGVWQDGAWNYAAFIRLIAASIGLSFITYFFEQSLENAYSELAESRQSEKNYVQNLEMCSITDPLTQLYNRRYLDVQFKQKFNKAKENNSYYALFILDLDKFKEYNDTYGHIAGDNVLQSVAKVLQNSMRREADSTFRLGGEEFCALFMADEHAKIIESVRNVRQNIENLHIPHIRSTFGSITASFGICIINDFETKNLDKMYKIADDNLYEAKENGRNCIVGEKKISVL